MGFREFSEKSEEGTSPNESLRYRREFQTKTGGFV
jgi:hypothetical protein